MTAGFYKNQHQKDMNAKEKWINETMGALDGIRRAHVNPELIDGFTTKIIHQKQKTSKIRPAVLWRVAATLAILISLNILGAIYYRQSYNTSQETTKAVASEYLYYLGPIKL
ncbi:MAG: hypothetical protein NT004_13615 [Bacteroidetes bacterium]|nr:hypothetical protein [Bacteroidota bacterium]